jgi:branched-chain amino acid transport system ATP-binding protein
MNTNLLTLNGIDTFYGPVQVHFKLNLRVDEGEIVCLLGGNASGKSTTMKIILGLLQPAAGDVVWRGKSLHRVPTHKRISLGLASVPEARRIFATMSVEENLLMGAHVREDRARVKQDRERVLELFPKLRERLGQAGGTLSGGEQQMLAMARALMGNPRLVCMDEPTMGLSPLWVERVLELIQTIRGQGTSFFMVEQNAHQALAIANRAYVLQNGHLVLEGGASELARDPRIRDAYLGGEQLATLKPQPFALQPAI